MTDDEIFYGKPGVTYHGLNGSVTILTTQPTDNTGLIERLRGLSTHPRISGASPIFTEAATALATKDAEIAAAYEACAKVADNMVAPIHYSSEQCDVYYNACEDTAAAIRALGAKS